MRAEAPGFVPELFRVDDRPQPVVELEPGADIEYGFKPPTAGRLRGAVAVVTDRPRSHAFFTDLAHGLTITRRAGTGEVDAVADADGLLRVSLPVGQATEFLVHPPTGDEPLVGVRRRVEPKDKAHGERSSDFPAASG